MANRRTGTGVAPSGRNSLLTPATQGVICASVRSGNWLETAAQMAGIDRDTLFAWKRKGKEDLARFPHIREGFQLPHLRVQA